MVSAKQLTFLNQEKYSLTETKPDAVIIGVRANTSYDYPGVEQGPDAIRQISQRYSNSDGTAFPIKTYDPDFGYILEGIRMQDAGNIEGEIGDFEEKVSQRIKEFLQEGILPITLGGDHYITKSVLEGYAEKTTVVHIDAHSDYLPFEAECPHGSVMRSVNDLEQIDQIIHVGLRGSLNTGKGINDSVTDGNTIITSAELKDKGINSVISSIDEASKVYISFDTDVLDPSIAPAVGVPEPLGIDYSTARQLLTDLADTRKVVGIDFVEYNPTLELNNITGIHIVNLLFSFVSKQFRNSEI